MNPFLAIRQVASSLRGKLLLKVWTLCIALLILVVPTLQALELKTAAQNSYPKYYKRNNAIMTGICIEIMQAVSKLDPTIKFTGQNTFQPMARIKKNLHSGKLDIFFGFAKSPSREKKYHYAQTPLYPVNYVIALRQTDPVNPTSLAEIQAMKEDGEILVLPNTGAARFLERHGNLHLDTGARNNCANLKKINIKRGRFLFYHDLGLKSTIKRDGWQDQIRILPVSFYQYYHYVVFAKATPKTVTQHIEKLLNQLEEKGELARIHAKYTQF